MSGQGCGAVVSFLGVVRADCHGARAVTALDYEAYDEMAERHIHQLAAEAQARWSLDALRIQHRVGRVEVGQISVVIAVAAQHRSDAYAASAFLIEAIKHRVPVWKRELYDDGTSAWVVCNQDSLAQAEPVGALA
jgi:molybdopterin synthase catalytic subunit